MKGTGLISSALFSYKANYELIIWTWDLQTYCSDREPKTHFLSEFSYQAKNHSTIFRMVWDTIVRPGPVDSYRHQDIKNCSIYTRFTTILVKKLE